MMQKGAFGGGDTPPFRPQKRKNTESLKETITGAQECGDGDGPQIPIDLCEGLSSNVDQSTSNSSNPGLCEKAYNARKYNKEGRKRHSSGQDQLAFIYFEKAAENDSVDALFNLGLCYEMGIGTEKNSAKAAVKYARASLKNHKHAAFNLGMMNIHGYSEMSPNETEGVKYLEKACKLGLGRAATELGAIAVHKEPPQWTVASDWFEKAANGKDEDPIGVLFLAHVYNNGYGKIEDKSKAKSLYERAAKKLQQLCSKEKSCDDWLLYALGLCFKHGWGLTQNIAQARTYFQKSNLPVAVEKLKELPETSLDSTDDDDFASESKESELNDLYDLVAFRPTIQASGRGDVMKNIVEMREQNSKTEKDYEEEESWGSYSNDGCCSGKVDVDSSVESVPEGTGTASGGSSKVATSHLEISEGNSVEFA